MRTFGGFLDHGSQIYGEVRGEVGVARLLPGLHLEEVAGQHPRLSLVVAEKPAGQQHVAIAALETPAIHEP